MSNLGKELELLSIIVSVAGIGALFAPAIGWLLCLAIIIGIPFGLGYAVASIPIPAYLLMSLEVATLFVIGYCLGAYFAREKAEAKLYRRHEENNLWFCAGGLLIFSLGIGFAHSWNEWGRLIAPGVYLSCLVGMVLGGKAELLRYRIYLERQNIQVLWP